MSDIYIMEELFKDYIQVVVYMKGYFNSEFRDYGMDLIICWVLKVIDRKCYFIFGRVIDFQVKVVIYKYIEDYSDYIKYDFEVKNY